MAETKVATGLPASVTPVPEAPPRKLLESYFTFSGEEYQYAHIPVTLPTDFPFEELLKPETWAHVAHKFHKDKMSGQKERTGTIITVRNTEHTLFAELYVRAVRERDLILHVLRGPIYMGPQESETARFEVRWNVGKRGYDVIRKSDREIVGAAEKFPTKELALAWIAEMEPAKKAA